jgi:hypothetical protein
MSIKVMPDGAVLDRVGEFIFGDRVLLGNLFPQDRGGYTDAVFKFVQGLVSTKTLIGLDRDALTNESNELKQHLISLGCMECSNLFANSDLASVKAAAQGWLSQHWDSVLKQLEQPSSTPAIAILGNLKRDFYYAFKLKHDHWHSGRYSAPGTVVHLPPNILTHLEQQLTDLAVRLGIERPDNLSAWIDNIVASHYRIYGEYLINLRAEYMPGWTRTSLMLGQASDNTEQIVMPFVALQAIGKVTHRKDIAKRVTEWKEREGKTVTEGIAELQDTLRGISDERVREKKLTQIRHLLGDSWPDVTLSLIRSQFWGIDGSISAAEVLAKYRWLWNIRAPRLHEEWSNRIAQLASEG